MPELLTTYRECRNKDCQQEALYRKQLCEDEGC
jgi:hypothetical protein